MSFADEHLSFRVPFAQSIGDEGERVKIESALRQRLKYRTWVYIQLPKTYEVAPCPCGNLDTAWSEFRNRVWCHVCRKDFKPEHWGIFDGPIGMAISEMFEIYFDRFHIASGKVLPDWQGVRHFKVDKRHRPVG